MRVGNRGHTIKTQPFKKRKKKRRETTGGRRDVVPKRYRIRTIPKSMKERLYKVRTTKARKRNNHSSRSKGASHRHTIMVTLPKKKKILGLETVFQIQLDGSGWVRDG